MNRSIRYIFLFFIVYQTAGENEASCKWIRPKCKYLNCILDLFVFSLVFDKHTCKQGPQHGRSESCHDSNNRFSSVPEADGVTTRVKSYAEIKVARAMTTAHECTKVYILLPRYILYLFTLFRNRHMHAHIANSGASDFPSQIYIPSKIALRI